MKLGIPTQIKLFEFANKGLSFSQNYKVSDFPRISDLSNNNQAALRAELNFSLKNRIPCIKGKIQLDLALTCQRCLNEVSIHLQPKFQLAFIKNEQQCDDLGAGFETILNTDEEFSTIEFITDEVLISMPMIPMHDYECSSYKDTQPIKQQKPKNPFATLKKLKKFKE